MPAEVDATKHITRLGITWTLCHPTVDISIIRVDEGAQSLPVVVGRRDGAVVHLVITRVVRPLVSDVFLALQVKVKW